MYALPLPLEKIPQIWHNAPMNFLCAIFAAVLTNCADVANFVFARKTGDRFDLTGQVRVYDNFNDPILNITDASGSTRLMGVRHVVTPVPFKSGDIIHATGIIDVPPDMPTHLPCAICRSAEFVSCGKLPPPADASISDIISGRFDCKSVRITGRIRRVIKDEIDTKCVYIQLLGDSNIIYLTIRTKNNDSLESKLRNLIDAEIETTGICHPSAYSRRRFLGYMVSISGLDSIKVLSPSPQNPYDVPLLDINAGTDASTINRLGRRRIIGTVIAHCYGRRVIIRTDRNEIHDIHLLGDPIPSYGTKIEAAGIPALDYYQVNLMDAVWRNASGSVLPSASPIDVSLKGLLTDGSGHTQINPNYHGKTVRTTGTLIDLPTKESGRGFAILKDDGNTVFIDISSAKDILDTVTSGCKIRATGICTINRDSSVNPEMGFQQLNGITIVLRSANDIEVLAYPPWWTPRRLAVVVTVLIILLVVIIIWNRSLKTIIDRKSRSLIREELAQIKLALRIDERTHLAVELHDSLSQNLSGIACQIAATKGLIPDGSSKIAKYLSTAERMLGSCRNELRRCIWDLRENALDEKDFSEAIRKTLDPVSIGAELTMQIDVPRSHMDDSTAHSILCIIRELVTNAIRHGKASSVHVAGEVDARTLRFSVADNGCGFNPATAPDANDGHFGLEGIRERIKRMNGAFDLKSSPENGCSAVITILSCRSNER